MRMHTLLRAAGTTMRHGGAGCAPVAAAVRAWCALHADAPHARLTLGADHEHWCPTVRQSRQQGQHGCGHVHAGAWLLESGKMHERGTWERSEVSC